MKVDVLIERDKVGRLHGYVIAQRQDGFIERGDDMLKQRIFRDVTSAKIECEATIRALFKLVDLKEIAFTFPEDWHP